jgi:hypothetical protein
MQQQETRATRLKRTVLSSVAIRRPTTIYVIPTFTPARLCILTAAVVFEYQLLAVTTAAVVIVVIVDSRDVSGRRTADGSTAAAVAAPVLLLALRLLRR